MEDQLEDAVLMTVLKTGNLIQYTVPSFPMFKATLREVKLQWEEEGGTIHTFDTFARECDPSIFQRWWRFPSTTRMRLLSRYEAISYSYKFLHLLSNHNISVCENCFFLHEKEFSRCIPTENYQFYDGDQVFVLWNWKWIDDPDIEQDDPDSEDERNTALSSNDDSSNEEAEDDIPAITHSVVFKCKGIYKRVSLPGTPCTIKPKDEKR